jgi:NADPH-dependent 2,4-dienoyl-CoA reductase/sulfur reductase-like enzyme
MLVADAYPNFSICGIPYHLSGEVPDWRNLAHRTTAEHEATGAELRTNHAATAIDRSQSSLPLPAMPAPSNLATTAW